MSDVDTRDDEIERLRAERDAAVKVRAEAIKRMKAAEAERGRLRHLLSLAEATLSEARLYIGYGNVGPLHNDATWRIIRSARAELKEAGRE